MYLLKTPGNHTIEISQDQLRSVLGEIEAELHRSQVYRRVLATLNKMLGSSAEQAKILVKAVSREAIALAFQQFAQQHQEVADISQQTEVTNVAPKLEPENNQELLQCLTSVKLQPQQAATNISENSLPSQTTVVANKLPNSVISPKQKSPTTTQTRGLNLNKKSSLPSNYRSKNPSTSLTLDIHPVPLYLGYATLVAGAVGGLSLMSQQANSDQTHRTNVDIQPSSSLSQSDQNTKTTVKPGIKSSNGGIVVGPDISPPEAF